jgi:hypothetical protein
VGKNRPKLDIYPWLKIWPRWILGVAEVGLSIYLMISFNFQFGLFFSAYWVLSLFVLLPFIRCTKCYYYGKRCNTAWGLLAKFTFPKGDPIYFQAGYALTVLLWPLRIFPIGLGLLWLLDGLTFYPDGLFGIYIGIIILHRVYTRAANCSVCRQQHVCPVYNPRILAPKKT